VIKTERLLLRRLGISDHNAFDTLFSNEEVMESSDDVPLSTEQVRAWLERQIKVYENSRGIEMLAITLRASNKVVGYCGLTQFPFGFVCGLESSTRSG
jgi:RimJ/RimL family protein N-acetyltransferase